MSVSDPAGPTGPGCSCTTTSLQSPVGEILVLRIAGEVDAATVHLVEAALAALLGRRPSHAIVDISALTFCSVRGLTVLTQAATAAAERWIEFSVSAAPRAVLRMWTLLGTGSDRPARHPTVGAGVLAAMDHQDQQRRHVTPPGPRGVPHPPRLRVVPDPDRFDGVADEDLVRRAHGGDIDAYRALVRRHRARMYRSALRMLTASPDPDDLTGDLAAHLYAALATFAEADHGADPRRGSQQRRG